MNRWFYLCFFLIIGCFSIVKAVPITDAHSVIAQIEHIYQTNKTNPNGFEKGLEQLYNEIKVQRKFAEAKQAYEDLHNQDGQQGSFQHICNKVLDADELSRKEDEIYKKFDLFSKHINEGASNQIVFLSKGEIQQVGKQNAGAELLSLKANNFTQSISNGACVLYSFLYAASRTEGLKNSLSNIIFKDRENYYINDLRKDRFIMIPFETLEKLPEEMNPSHLPILRALGSYGFALFKEAFERTDFSQYILALEGRDLFFGQPTLSFNAREFDSHQFKADGSLTVGNQSLRGNFVLSIGTTMGGGHAIAAYYDISGKSWKLYNNIGGSEEVINLTLKGSKYTITNVIVIGNYTIH